MVYPEEYKKRVLEALPDMDIIKTCLNNGDEMLGRILDDTRLSGTISPLEFVAAFNNSEKMMLLYRRSLKALEIEKLYNEFFELRREQRK